MTRTEHACSSRLRANVISNANANANAHAARSRPASVSKPLAQRTKKRGSVDGGGKCIGEPVVKGRGGGAQRSPLRGDAGDGPNMRCKLPCGCFDMRGIGHACLGGSA